MTESKASTSQPLFETLSKLGNYLIGVTLLWYGAGFAITNLYLGSMGIVTFDLLKARYIVSGLLFSFFLCAIIYLVLGLIQTLRKNHESSKVTLIKKILLFSFFNIGVLYIVVPAIGLFAGTTGTQPYNIPQPTQAALPWSDWLAQAPLSTLRTVSVLSGVIIFSVILVVIGFIMVNPKNKDGIRTPRRQILTDAFKKMKESKGKEFTSLIVAFVLFYLLSLSGNLLSFYVAGKVSTVAKTTISVPTAWAHFFNAVVIVYAFIAIYLTLITLYPPITTTYGDTALATSSSLIYLAAICMIAIVPIYAFRVYPALPQQIGGGQLIKVQLVISDEKIEPKFSDPSVDAYLIDRTSNTSFFLLQSTTDSKYKIVEVQNDVIQSITYAHSP